MCASPVLIVDHGIGAHRGARCGKILRTGGRGAPPSMGSGVAFEPDGEGWKVSYIPGKPVWEEYELPTGELSNAYDLHIAAAAALKPLVELGEQAAHYFAEQDQKRA